MLSLVYYLVVIMLLQFHHVSSCHKKTQHKENMRKDKIEIEEHGLVHEKVLVKCEEVVKEEMMEMESEVQYK